MNLILIFVAQFVSCISASRIRTCEPIKVDMCKDLGYKMTGMPNLLNSELQQDAKRQLQTFSPLIQYGCSKRLTFFLCSAYVPMCTEKVPDPIGPCRPLCEDVRNRCLPVLQQFGFPWPPALNCSKFPPANNQHHMCMPGPDPEPYEPYDVVTGRKPYRDSLIPSKRPHNLFPLRNTVKHGSKLFHPSQEYQNTYQPPNYPAIPSVVPKPDVETKAPIHRHTHNYGLCDRYVKVEHYFFINRTQNCAHDCNADVSFTKEEKDFAQVWIMVWTIFCFLFTLVTMLTYSLDPNEFKYPERPIMYINMCYWFCSIAYVIRLAAGRDSIACHSEPQWNDAKILVQDGFENVTCIVVFILLFFFGLASSMWWVILTACWYLAAGKRRPHESINVYSSYFHLLAWAIPAALSVTILVMRVVDADELSGVCYVGNHNSDYLLVFVIVPQLVLLVVGALLLVSGFMAIYKTKHNRKLLMPTTAHMLKIADKMESLVTRIAIFSVLYIIPSTCTVATYIYEYKQRDIWLTSSHVKPIAALFYTRIFMCLIVGTVSGFPIFDKIWVSWKRIGTNKKRPAAKTSPKTVYIHANGHHNRNLLLVEKKSAKTSKSKTGSETTV